MYFCIKPFNRHFAREFSNFIQKIVQILNDSRVAIINDSRLTIINDSRVTILKQKRFIKTPLLK